MHVALMHDHVGGAGGGGGGVRQMLGLAKGLLAAGHRVTVVCHDHDSSTDLASIDAEVEVRAVRRCVEPLLGQFAVSRRQLSGMRAVAALVPTDADVINSHEWPAVHAGRLAQRRLGTPHVWTRNDETMLERGLFPRESPIDPGRWTSRVRHVLYNLTDVTDARAADAIVVLDRRNATWVRRSYRRDAEIVRSGPAPHFFDPPEREGARAALGLQKGELFVVAFGIWFSHRRFEDLVEAAALLPTDLPGGVRVQISGWDGIEPRYADRIAALVRDRGLEHRVHLGRSSVSEAELKGLYAAADVFVFPNDRQTWGLAPLEALASGTPAVISRGAGVHEVLEGRSGVHLVPPRDPAAIAAAIPAAAAEREAVEETRTWLRQELTAERYAADMVRVFNDVAHRAR